MISNRRMAHWIVLGPVLTALCMVGSGADKSSDNAKMYQKSLDAMVGQPYADVTAQLGKWEFQPLDSFTEENPAWKDISKHNRTKVKFSKDEFNQVFAPGGKFKVLISNKLIGTDTSHFGEIDAMGMSAAKEASFNLEQYTVVRLVFKDDKLVHARVWPKLDQSGFSGGTWRTRGS